MLTHSFICRNVHDLICTWVVNDLVPAHSCTIIRVFYASGFKRWGPRLKTTPVHSKSSVYVVPWLPMHLAKCWRPWKNWMLQRIYQKAWTHRFGRGFVLSAEQKWRVSKRYYEDTAKLKTGNTEEHCYFTVSYKISSSVTFNSGFTNVSMINEASLLLHIFQVI